MLSASVTALQLPNNCCLLWRSFVLSVSIAAFFSLSPLKNCSFSIWKWDFAEVKTCLDVNPSHGITLKCPLHEGDCLSGPTLHHLLLLSPCQVSAEQMKVRTFQPKNGKALSWPSKLLKTICLKIPSPLSQRCQSTSKNESKGDTDILKKFLLSDRMMTISKNEKRFADLGLAETKDRTFN